MNEPKIIAFYLPQFYPIPENDMWWGKGFTEWTNVAKAKPLFRNHNQPRIPADLSFYDLRVPEVREQQSRLAREAGISGFCYWHYWFGNRKQLLYRVWDEVIATGEPDFPICLGWANHSWFSKTWDKSGSDKLLIEQKYCGESDYEDHFYYALKAFKDKRYITISDQPVFFIYDALAVPAEFLQIWQKLAKENGFSGICFIGRIKQNSEYDDVIAKGFSYVTIERLNDILYKRPTHIKRYKQIINILQGRARNCVLYKDAIPYFIDKTLDTKDKFIPTIIPSWDHSPRSGSKGLILHNSTPELFRKHVSEIFDLVKRKPIEDQIIFLKSWNEWAEGNYMEPDLKWGKQYINVLGEEVKKYSSDQEIIKNRN